MAERRRSSHGNRKRALSQIISDIIPGQRREVFSITVILPTDINMELEVQSCKGHTDGL
jgi:hypothetical protein